MARMVFLIGFFLIWRFRDTRFRIFDVVLDDLDSDGREGDYWWDFLDLAIQRYSISDIRSGSDVSDGDGWMIKPV
jgi:hypothetical protein